MRLVIRFFHWLICIAVPAVIAACYGAPYTENRRVFGTVTDDVYTSHALLRSDTYQLHGSTGPVC